LEAAAAAAEQGKGGRVNVVADAEEVGLAVNYCMQIYADIRTYVHTYIHTYIRAHAQTISCMVSEAHILAHIWSTR